MDYKGLSALSLQKIRSRAFTSFSVLGLAIVLGVGGLLIVLATALESLTDFVLKRVGRRIYPRLEWSANGTLQLQRLAHEALGYGGAWACATDAVPVTRCAGEPLAVLDVQDIEHPRLLPRMTPRASPSTPTALTPQPATNASAAPATQAK